MHTALKLGDDPLVAHHKLPFATHILPCHLESFVAGSMQDKLLRKLAEILPRYIQREVIGTGEVLHGIQGPAILFGFQTPPRHHRAIHDATFRIRNHKIGIKFQPIAKPVT